MFSNMLSGEYGQQQNMGQQGSLRDNGGTFGPMFNAVSNNFNALMGQADGPTQSAMDQRRSSLEQQNQGQMPMPGYGQNSFSRVLTGNYSPAQLNQMQAGQFQPLDRQDQVKPVIYNQRPRATTKQIHNLEIHSYRD